MLGESFRSLRLRVSAALLCSFALLVTAGTAVADSPSPSPSQTTPDQGADDQGNTSAAGERYQPAKTKIVPKQQQYHIQATVAQGSQAPVDMSEGISRITSFTEKHRDPRAPGLVFTFDEQQGLRLSASSDTEPGNYVLRILGEGCFDTQCELAFNTKITVTVIAPVPAQADVEAFTQPSQDRIDEAAPLTGGGGVLVDELILTLGTPDSPGTLEAAQALAALVGAQVTGGLADLGVFELRWMSPVDLDEATRLLSSEPSVAGVSRTTVGLIQEDKVPETDWSDDGRAATWPFTEIRAPQAWDITTGGSSVSVGIVDGGAVYKDHEDLDVTEVLAGSADDHATHVAGLACAEANGIGLVGVSWGCPIVSSGVGGFTDKEVLEAMRSVALSGVKVVNASLGYGKTTGENLCMTSTEASETVQLAKDNSTPFWQLFNGPTGRNIVWTFAAGNNCSNGVHSPWGQAWSLPNVITVAATNSENSDGTTGALASFSNFGDGVEVAAPGGVGLDMVGGADGLWSTTVKDCGLFNLFKCSDYEPMYGTSMAAPIVAGVAALARSVDLDMKAADVATCVVNTAGNTVGSVTSRSSQPVIKSRTPVVSFSGQIPKVNAEAAVRCAKYGSGSGDVLVAGAGDRTGSGNGTDLGDLAAALVRSGYETATSETLPDDLTPYSQVWYIDTDALSESETDRVAAFVESGGSIYLTGEWGCCSVDTSTLSLLNRLTTNTDATIAHAGTAPNDALTANASAIEGIASTPNSVSTFTVATAGRLSGVPAENVVAYSGSDSSRPSVAAWSRNQVRGSGKIVVVMDINWFAEQYRASNWEEWTENIADFLGNS